MRRPNFDGLARKLAAVLPRASIVALGQQLLRERRLALCLHRVSSGPRGAYRRFTIEEDVLDTLLALLLSMGSASSAAPWLTVSFDDGYEDAAQYILSRAPRQPDVEWIFFVCPEKTERRLGFPWDGGALEGLADDPRFRLASVELCRQLQSLPNVRLGNHTNRHLRATDLSEEEAREELSQSFEDFERLFGKPSDFAFPFGTPGHEFDASHVRMLRARGDFRLWSTEARPYTQPERDQGRVLPRFSVDEHQDAEEIATWILARTARHRLFGSRHDFGSR